MKAKEIIDMFPKFSKREEFVEEAIKDNEINELYNKALNARYILDLLCITLEERNPELCD